MLKQLHPVAISEEEKAFGISQDRVSTGILLRNWVTYLLRECITQEEKAAYYSLKPDIGKVKRKFNHALEFEIYQKVLRYKKENNLTYLDKVVTYTGILCTKQNNGEYKINKFFK